MADLPIRDDFDKLKNLLQLRYGMDLSPYGREFLERRLARRLERWHIAGYMDYVVILKRHPEEREELLRVLSINVTEFFRDLGVYESLEKRVLPEMLLRRGHTGELRVWSAGCATGEEAYTLSMILHNFIRGHNPDLKYSVQATDINAQSIEFARKAVYAGEAAAAVPEPYGRYFERIEGAVMIRSTARDAVRFSKHDLTSMKELPIADLIVCRNV